MSVSFILKVWLESHWRGCCTWRAGRENVIESLKIRETTFICCIRNILNSRWTFLRVVPEFSDNQTWRSRHISPDMFWRCWRSYVSIEYWVTEWTILEDGGLTVKNQGDKVERVHQEVLSIGRVVIVLAGQLASSMLPAVQRRRRNAKIVSQKAEAADQSCEFNVRYVRVNSAKSVHRTLCTLTLISEREKKTTSSERSNFFFRYSLNAYWNTASQSTNSDL